MTKPRKHLEPVEVGGNSYEHVATSQTDQVCGAVGGAGDFLARVVVTVFTSATGTCAIQDGNDTAHTIVPANTPIGVYVVELGIRSVIGAWSITTGAGAEAIAIGDFTEL